MANGHGDGFGPARADRRAWLARCARLGGQGLVMPLGLAGLAGCATTVQAGRESLPASGLAEPASSLLPPPGEPVPVHVPEVEQELLGEVGPTLIVAGRRDLPLVSVALRVRCGSAADPPGRSGCALLLSQMLARGAMRQGRPVDGATLARQAEALGGSIGTGVQDSQIWLEMTVMTPLLPQALALLVDLLRRPLLPPAELQQVRAQALDGLGLRLQDPALLAALVARRTVWGRSLHGAVPTPESLSAVRREDLLTMHRRWFRPDRVAVVLTGDIDLAEARALLRPMFAGWRIADAPMPHEMPSAPPQPLLPATLLIDLPRAAQTAVLVCAPHVALDAPDRRAGQMAATVVGGGYSARLNQAVRIRRGLSYGADARIEQQRAGGLFIAQARTAPRHAAEVVQLMRERVLSPGREPPTPEELAARRAALIGSLARRLDTDEGLNARLGELWAQGIGLGELHGFAAGIAGVEGADVQRFVQRHWPAAALRTLVVGPLEAAGPALAGLDPKALRLAAADLVLDSPVLRR